MIWSLAAAPLVTRTPTETTPSPASAILLPGGAVVQGPLLRVGASSPRLGAPAREGVDASLAPRPLGLMASLQGAQPEGLESAGQSPRMRPHLPRSEVLLEGRDDDPLLFFGDPRRQLVTHGGTTAGCCRASEQGPAPSWSGASSGPGSGGDECRRGRSPPRRNLAPPPCTGCFTSPPPPR